MFTISGKTAIVTGCGGHGGIGEAVALAFARAGINVFGVDITELDNMKKEVESYGVKFEYMTADLCAPSENLMKEIVETAAKSLGSVDILINNAGIARREDAINYSEKDWDAALNINLKTCFLLSQAAARQMMRQGTGGKIVNMASMLAFSGGIRVPSYAASKHGIAGITKAFANEWARHHINVNAVAPGYVDTPMNQAHKDDAERYRQLLDRIPYGRWAAPSEIAAPVLFLCTDEASYIHGYTLAVDGGWLAR